MLDNDHVPIWEMNQMNPIDSWIELENEPKVFMNPKRFLN